MNNKFIKIGFKDFFSTIASYQLVMVLGGQDIRQRYKRSRLGPFWITISMAVMITTMGVVFANLFKTDIKEFLPFLTLGLILWSFIIGAITEGCDALISSEGIIKQLPIPLGVHMMRTLWKNFIIFLHNIAIFPIVIILFSIKINISSLLVIPGIFILIMNLLWIIFLLAIVCARFRDMTQIILSIMQVVFYLTPVIWMPKLLSHHVGIKLLQFNPFYHLIELVRAPLLGQTPTITTYTYTLLMALIGLLLSILVIGKLKYKIPYWV